MKRTNPLGRIGSPPNKRPAVGVSRPLVTRGTPVLPPRSNISSASTSKNLNKFNPIPVNRGVTPRTTILPSRTSSATVFKSSIVPRVGNAAPLRSSFVSRPAIVPRVNPLGRRPVVPARGTPVRRGLSPIPRSAHGSSTIRRHSPVRTSMAAPASNVFQARRLGQNTTVASSQPHYGRPQTGPGGKPINFIVRETPKPPPGRRMPLILSDEKAVIGDKGPGPNRWTCAKCTRINRTLRKVCGRQECGGIAPLNVKQVVVDCANVGCRYGESHSMRPPRGEVIDKERHRKFHWNGIRNCVKHYLRLGLIPSLVSKENWPAPMPQDLEKYSCTVPRVDGDQENDDYFVLKIAYQNNCFYVTNDNFRNWKEEVEDQMMAKWFLGTKRLLHVSYVFDNAGGFIPRHDAKLEWNDDDSLASSQRGSLSPRRDCSPIRPAPSPLPDIVELSDSEEEQPAIIIRGAPRNPAMQQRIDAVQNARDLDDRKNARLALSAAVPKSQAMAIRKQKEKEALQKNQDVFHLRASAKQLSRRVSTPAAPTPASPNNEIEFDGEDELESLGSDFAAGSPDRVSGVSGPLSPLSVPEQEVIVIDDDTDGAEDMDLEMDGEDVPAEGEDDVDEILFDGEEPEDELDELELDGFDTDESDLEIDVDEAVNVKNNTGVTASTSSGGDGEIEVVEELSDNEEEIDLEIDDLDAPAVNKNPSPVRRLSRRYIFNNNRTISR